MIKNASLGCGLGPSMAGRRTVVMHAAQAGAAAPTYRYWRWQITRRKPGAAHGVQISEWELRLGGARLPTMGAASVTAPGAITPGAENPPKLVDGSLDTKFLDFAFDDTLINELSSVETGDTTVIIDLGAPTEADGYAWWTANDVPARDPISWTVAGSPDGITWTLLDTVESAPVTDARKTLAYEGGFV